MQRKHAHTTIVAGLLLILLAIVYDLALGVDPVITLTFVNAGTIMIVIAAIALNRAGRDQPQDERTRKLGAYGLAKSWFVTFIGLNLLFWIDYLELAALTARHIVSILMALMLLSALVFQWNYKRHGDVQ